jgi:hypothetical protein
MLLDLLNKKHYKNKNKIKNKIKNGNLWIVECLGK